MSREYGYVRVSSKDQKTDRQMVEMRRLCIPEKNIYQDKQSGKNFERTQYQKMIGRLKEGDTLFVLSIDRLGRNYEEIQQQWRCITKDIKADIVVLDMPLLDTRREKDLMGTFVSDLVLQVLSYCAETERINIRSRQRAGIDAALAKGVRFGAPEKPLPDNFTLMHEQWERGELSLREAAKGCGMAKSTFYEKAKKNSRS